MSPFGRSGSLSNGYHQQQQPQQTSYARIGPTSYSHPSEELHRQSQQCGGYSEGQYADDDCEYRYNNQQPPPPHPRFSDCRQHHPPPPPPPPPEPHYSPRDSSKRCSSRRPSHHDHENKKSSHRRSSKKHAARNGAARGRGSSLDLIFLAMGLVGMLSHVAIHYSYQAKLAKALGRAEATRKQQHASLQKHHTALGKALGDFVAADQPLPAKGIAISNVQKEGEIQEALVATKPKVATKPPPPPKEPEPVPATATAVDSPLSGNSLISTSNSQQQHGKAATKQPPHRLRVLMGIFSTLDNSAALYRCRHRRLFALWQDPRLCSLAKLERENDETCELIYTFVVGGANSVDAPPEIVDDERRSLLVPPTRRRPASSCSAGMKKEGLCDFDNPDITWLNIRENMNEGKSQTWLYYASQQANQFGLDYVMKMDVDSILHIHEFFTFAYISLPPAPYNSHFYIGGLSDKANWNNNPQVVAAPDAADDEDEDTTMTAIAAAKPVVTAASLVADERIGWVEEQAREKKRRAQFESYFDEHYDHVHVYMTGQLYMMSTDLAEVVAEEAQSMTQEMRIECNGKSGSYNSSILAPWYLCCYCEGREDHDVGAMAFHGIKRAYAASTPIHLVAIGGKSSRERFWEHPVKTNKRWNRLLEREIARQAGKEFEGRILNRNSSYGFVREMQAKRRQRHSQKQQQRQQQQRSTAASTIPKRQQANQQLPTPALQPPPPLGTAAAQPVVQEQPVANEQQQQAQPLSAELQQQLGPLQKQQQQQMQQLQTPQQEKNRALVGDRLSAF